LIQDAEGRTFKFDGNDKQMEVKDTSQTVVGKYFYDASGARIKKVAGVVTTIFVYDAGGALAAEYSTDTPTNPITSYMTTDHLGSPRVITDKNGNVISRRDFMPFGEEIARINSGSDAIRKKFTGYEKDLETNLDFAEARMYQTKHGRFTAVDPLMASASPGNPQTFNRYSYTGNNPVNYTDPSGLDVCESGNTVTFEGRGNPCTGDGKRINPGQEITLASNSASVPANGGKIARAGDRVRVEADDTITIVQTVKDRIADQITNIIRGTSDDVLTTTASQSSSIFTERPLTDYPEASSTGTSDEVPCFSRSQICSGTPTEVDDPDLIGLEIVLTGCGLFFDPCDVAGGALSAGKGDVTGAILSAPSAIPLLGIPAGITKIGKAVKKAETAVEATTDATKMADELQQTIGKNRVSAETPTHTVNVDLQGKGHFDKGTSTLIPTPHVQIYKKNVGPQGKINYSKKGSSIRPASKADVRMARNILKRRK
jgi:RHS repeat-associated protein